MTTMSKELWEEKASEACEQIRQLREAGFSQPDLSDRLGVTDVTIRRWEYMRSLPNEKNIKRINKLYRVTIGEKTSSVPQHLKNHIQENIELLFWG